MNRTISICSFNGAPLSWPSWDQNLEKNNQKSFIFKTNNTEFYLELTGIFTLSHKERNKIQLASIMT